MIAMATSLAAADLVIEKPDFKVGDSWEFLGTENGQPYRWSRTILELMDDGRMKIRVTRNDRETIEYHDRAMNVLINGRADLPRVQARYPIKVGDAWSVEAPTSNPNVLEKTEGKVVGRERVTVPLGTYDCLKVMAVRHTAAARATVQYAHITRWHCPEIKWIAKEVYALQTSSVHNPAENVGRGTDTALVRFTPGN